MVCIHVLSVCNYHASNTDSFCHVNSQDMLWYACHSFLPASKEPGHGKRNARTFLVGAFLYIVLYVILKNLQLKYGSWYGAMPIDAALSGLFLTILADGATLGWLYKLHYGRTITHELGDDNGKYEFDKDTGKYKLRQDQNNDRAHEVPKETRDLTCETTDETDVTDTSETASLAGSETSHTHH